MLIKNIAARDVAVGLEQENLGNIGRNHNGSCNVLGISLAKYCYGVRLHCWAHFYVGNGINLPRAKAQTLL